MGQTRIRQARSKANAIRVSDVVRHSPRATGAARQGRLPVPRVRAIRHAVVSVLHAQAGRASGQHPLSAAQFVRTLVTAKHNFSWRASAVLRLSLVLAALALGLALSPHAEAANG